MLGIVSVLLTTVILEYIVPSGNRTPFVSTLKNDMFGCGRPAMILQYKADVGTLKGSYVGSKIHQCRSLAYFNIAVSGLLYLREELDIAEANL